MPICRKCNSEKAAKSGLVEGRQRYRCKECGHKYYDTTISPVKMTIDELCEMLISETKLREDMGTLLSFLSGLKMKPLRYHKNSYKCHYKSKRVVYIEIHENLIRIKVCITNHFTGNVYNDIEKMDIFFQTLPIEMKYEYMKHLIYCKNCTTCAPGYDIKIGGELHKHICEKSLYYRIENPTTEQFEWIKKFIIARRTYIENYIK